VEWDCGGGKLCQILRGEVFNQHIGRKKGGKKFLNGFFFPLK
jgi:hypothetical protein